MYGWKLLATALGTGAFLGTIGGTAYTPTLKPAPEATWRQGLAAHDAPASYDPAIEDIVAAPPQDLAPQGWTYGMARAFPDDSARGARRAIAFRWDDGAAVHDEDWSYAAREEDEAVRPGEAAPVIDPVLVEVPTLAAAEAAADAARDAQDQGLEPVTLAALDSSHL